MYSHAYLSRYAAPSLADRSLTVDYASGADAPEDEDMEIFSGLYVGLDPSEAETALTWNADEAEQPFAFVTEISYDGGETWDLLYEDAESGHYLPAFENAGTVTVRMAAKNGLGVGEYTSVTFDVADAAFVPFETEMSSPETVLLDVYDFFEDYESFILYQSVDGGDWTYVGDYTDYPVTITLTESGTYQWGAVGRIDDETPTSVFGVSSSYTYTAPTPNAPVAPTSIDPDFSSVLGVTTTTDNYNVTFVWTDDNNTNVTSYVFEIGTRSNTSDEIVWSTYATVDADTKSLPVTVSANPGAYYTFAVSAVNAGGTSERLCTTESHIYKISGGSGGARAILDAAFDELFVDDLDIEF